MDNKKMKNTSQNYEMLMMASKGEYDESFKHREKLDSKVNILFTVYAFMVLIYIQLINSIEKNTVDCIKKLILGIANNKIVDVKLFMFLIGFILFTVFIVYNVLSLLNILKGITMEHFDSSQILDKNLFESYDKANAKFISALYEECKEKNNSVVNNKYFEYNKTINRTIIMIIIIIFTYLLKIIL